MYNFESTTKSMKHYVKLIRTYQGKYLSRYLDQFYIIMEAVARVDNCCGQVNLDGSWLSKLKQQSCLPDLN